MARNLNRKQTAAVLLGLKRNASNRPYKKVFQAIHSCPHGKPLTFSNIAKVAGVYQLLV